MMDSRDAHPDLHLDLERLALVLAGSQQGFWDWDIRTGEVRRNERWAEILGYTLEEIEPTVRHGENLIHPDDREAVRKSLQDHLEGRTQAHESEHRMRTKDGNYKWILDSGRIVERDAQGCPTRMSGTHTDITKRRQAEESLRKFSRAVEQSITTVMITDADGVIEYVNPTFTRLSGYTAEEVIGKKPSISKSGITKREEYSRLWETIKGGGEWKGEFLNKRKDGQLYWVSSSISPIRDPNGVILNFLAIQEDVTERKRIEEALARQNEYLSALHDISLGILSRLSLGDVLQSVIQRSAQLLGTSSGAILLLDSERKELEVKSATGRLEATLGSCIQRGEGVAGKVWETGRSLVITDYSNWEGRSPQIPVEALRFLAGTPLVSGSQVIGVLLIGHESDMGATFGKTETDILNRFGQMVSIGIDNARLYSEAQRVNKKIARELVLAGRVQRSLLPIELPPIAGWDLAVKFEPAGETSGDFFDVRLLPNGNVCILVADVIDKGVSAALFMALTWQAIRVYADRFPANPEYVLGALNNYVLSNIHTGQFLTIFFGILDPARGKLCYCNAGHHPPFHVRRKNPDTLEGLKATGIPVGFIEDTVWEQATVELDPGDVLAIYTDGVTEARSPQETFFGDTGLLGSLRKKFRNSPRDVVGAVFADLQTFMGDSARTDDITLLVFKREELQDTHPHPKGNNGGAESVLL